MTPELRQFVTDSARSLQLRLGHGRVDPTTAATEAQRVFTEASDAVRVRWLSLELHGYGDLVDSRPLHEVLGISLNDRLAAHVGAYRAQRGLKQDGGAFRHFFVEPLSELIAASASVAMSGGTSTLELRFEVSPSAPTHPLVGTFSRDVFERVVAGFVAALHLQLGTLTK
jgi:hypothetical protein